MLLAGAILRHFERPSETKIERLFKGLLKVFPMRSKGILHFVRLELIGPGIRPGTPLASLVWLSKALRGPIPLYKKPS